MGEQAPAGRDMKTSSGWGLALTLGKTALLSRSHWRLRISHQCRGPRQASEHGAVATFRDMTEAQLSQGQANSPDLVMSPCMRIEFPGPPVCFRRSQR